jgi:hypothetical protein
MDTITTYRPIIEQVLRDYAQIPYAHEDIQVRAVFDREADHYLLMLVEREGIWRVHRCLVHVDICEGKIWIQRDGTEHGIARDFVEAGIPKDHIVLAFRSPEIQQNTEFAVA